MTKEKTCTLPQVLLLGNGLNQGFGGANWSSAIGSIWTNKTTSHVDAKDVPFPLQIVIGTEDNVDEALKKNPDFIYGLKNLNEIKKPLDDLLKLEFDHILTTNYSYELERVMTPSIGYQGTGCSRFLAHTEKCSRAEPKYMLHTYNQIDYNGHTNRVWHIHGEARKTASVVIGHYNYGRLLGKYIEELNKRKNSQCERQKSGEPPFIETWLDAFIMGNVYILGFGFDFSELDLWWLLNRKKRENADCGRTVFYEPSYGKEVKHALLRVYGVEVKDLGFKSENPNYQEFYMRAIEDIHYNIKHERED